MYENFNEYYKSQTLNQKDIEYYQNCSECQSFYQYMTQGFHYSLLKLHVGLQFRGLSNPSNMPKASRSYVLSVRLIPIVLKVYNCQISSLTYRYVNSSIKDNVTTVGFFFFTFLLIYSSSSKSEVTLFIVETCNYFLQYFF